MIKYFWPIKSATFFVGLFVVLAVCTIFAHYSYSNKSSCQIEFVLKTPSAVDFGIYYDIGEGLTQKDHQTKRIEKIDQKTKISFCIPVYSQLRSLRFDPGTQPLKMDIYSITLIYGDGTQLEVPFDSLRPGKQILSHEWNETVFSFETIPDANDPYFSLTKLHSGFIQDDTKTKAFHYGIWLLGGIMIMLMGRFIYLFIFLGL